MSPSRPADSTSGPPRRLLIDLVRAYEGILFGLVLLSLAIVASSATLGPVEFGALVVVPAVTMVLSMHRGAPRGAFRVRVVGALLGWVAAWILFPPLFLAAYWAGARYGGEYAVFTILAVLDGFVLGLVLMAVDRAVSWWRRRRAVAAS